MNRQYAILLLLIGFLPNMMSAKHFETKENTKRRTDREAFAITATGAIIGTLCYRSSHRFPIAGYRRSHPLLTQNRINAIGGAATTSGFVTALLYKIWKTDESIVHITARQALNCFGVSLVSNIGFGFIGV